MKDVLLSLSKKSVVALALLVFLVAPFAPLTAQAQSDISSSNRNGFGDERLAPAATTAGSATPGAASGCSFTSPGTWDLCLTNVVYVFTVGIGSGFAYISAYFFDWAVALSLNSTAYALDFVSTGWATARDLANMTFLFILLYIAFKIMFEADTNSTSKMLVTTIVIALLVNFSFFFTRLAIDAGNILAIQFYNAIEAPPVGSASGVPSTGATLVNGTLNAVNGGTSFSNSKDLTASIMGMLNLQGLFNTTEFGSWYKTQQGGQGFMVVLISLSFLYITAGIILWILTVAFITNGIKFLVRIVVLWFLIIASPLAFAAYAIPDFKGYFKKWRDLLISHSFYPVAFMFIFLILTNFATQMGQNNSLLNGLFNSATGQNPSSAVAAIGYAAANVFIRLGFVIAMLYIGMEVANKIGVMGASQADKIGNWVGGRLKGTYRSVGGAVGAGTPAWVGRNTAGFLGDKFAKSNTGRNWAAEGGLLKRTAWRAAGALGTQSFDARGGLAKIGVKETVVGKAGGQGGYTAKFDARVKERQAESKKLKPTESKIVQTQEKIVKNLSDTQKLDLTNKIKALEAARTNHETIGDDASKQAFKRAKDAFNNTAKTILDDAKKKAGVDNDKVYAKSISNKTWKNMWGIAQGSPLYIRSAEREAAAQIRGAKDDAQRLKNILAF